MSDQQRPDVAEVLGQLKDFQVQTVEHVFDRLYGDNATRRFLLADEVGLGKTLVAKGVIAKAIDHLWDDVDRIDVIYICSNADIARQNLTRLRPGGHGIALPTRITLLPLNAAELSRNKLNFISFTPGTSLDTKAALGIVNERALLHRMLRELWGFGQRKAPKKLFQGFVRDLESFQGALDRIERRPMSVELHEEFRRSVSEQPELRRRFDELVPAFTHVRSPGALSREVKDARRALVGDLRRVLARTCIDALEPDLVLLDEFQRFKHLLTGDSDAGELARQLFDWQDEARDERARVLLMSATPYKMFTLDGEDTDDHYRDFVATLEFLAGPERAAEIGQDLSALRRELHRLDSVEDGRIDELHASVESGLREVIVRTERVGAASDPNAMLRTMQQVSGQLTEQDVRDYLAMQRVATSVGQSDIVEFWKSSPYLANLLGDGYQLSRRLKEAASAAGPARGDLVAALAEARLIEPDDIRHWNELDPGNARMRSLVDDMVASGAWRLLWLPPSMPYYEPSGPFADAGVGDLTKRLVFSSWAVVPRAVASLVSYAAEREMWKAGDPTALNTSEVHAARRGRLALGVENERPTGMPVLALMFPSTSLARLCDPLRDAAGAQSRSVDQLRRWAIEQVAEPLARITADADREGREDESWYWAAPLLLDAAMADPDASDWLDRHDAARAWSGGELDDGRWVDHVERAAEVLASPHALGRPPADLAEVVAELGLFGWGTSALRALGRVATPDACPATIREHAAKIAWALRSLFNLPEVNAFVPSTAPGPSYWRQCLSYTAAGNLQAVLDEFVHVLVESLGYSQGDDAALGAVAERISATLTLRATRVTADRVSIDATVQTIEFEPMRLRARFAARFGDEAGDDGIEATRPDALRAAFNSPFWPFVLASTSVGQEGLDFHAYCHAIVHWNLPPNPVDLEQREGRINRYKNHAVRRNVARAHHHEGLARAGGDPWSTMFEVAIEQRPDDACDLVPFWLYPVADGAMIERHVPSLPLSREVARYEQLCRALVVYRMAFGQARQEDLVAFLLERFDKEQIADLRERLSIDLRPRAATVAGG